MVFHRSLNELIKCLLLNRIGSSPPWFVSLVYSAKSSTNEEDSEILFRKFVEDVDMDQLDARLVSEYILATKRHDVSLSDDPDLRAFIDLDMAVVGRERKSYLKYASQVRSSFGLSENYFFDVTDGARWGSAHDPLR